MRFPKVSTPENKVKQRYFMKHERLNSDVIGFEPKTLISSRLVTTSFQPLHYSATTQRSCFTITTKYT